MKLLSQIKQKSLVPVFKAAKLRSQFLTYIRSLKCHLHQKTTTWHYGVSLGCGRKLNFTIFERNVLIKRENISKEEKQI